MACVTYPEMACSNQRTKVGVGSSSPSTGLFTCADKFNRKVRAVSGCHVISLIKYSSSLGSACYLPHSSLGSA
jgi:hypothetical protein